MTEYGLKPPSLMMGTMKVKDAVKVHFDLLLKADPTRAARGDAYSTNRGPARDPGHQQGAGP
jgi:hypothetical protein